MRFQQALQPLDSVRVVVDADRLSHWMEVDVEPFFTDVDSDIHLRCVWLGRDLALHAGLAPHHLFRPSAKGGRIQLIHGFKPRGYDPARPPPGGGHPQAVIPRLKAILGQTDHARGAAAISVEI